jgi:hypothetical protein
MVATCNLQVFYAAIDTTMSRFSSIVDSKFERVVNLLSNNCSSIHASQWAKNCEQLIKASKKEAKCSEHNERTSGEKGFFSVFDLTFRINGTKNKESKSFLFFLSRKTNTFFRIQ